MSKWKNLIQSELMESLSRSVSTETQRADFLLYMKKKYINYRVSFREITKNNTKNIIVYNI